MSTPLLHIGCAADGGRVYALGGFVEQNRRSGDLAFAEDEAFTLG